VRSAVGPNTEPGLEVVRIAEAADRQGIALVRTRTPFAPFGAGDVSASKLTFTDPVVLLRAPYRVSFSYSSGDGAWQDTWGNNGQLPAAVRFLLRDTTTGRTLAVSSATMVHVELPAGCADGSGKGAGQSPSGPQAGAASSQTVAAAQVALGASQGSQGCSGSGNSPGAPVNAGPAPNGPQVGQ
jgi:general secretion pathway protein J